MCEGEEPCENSKCHDDDECSVVTAEQQTGYFGDDIDDLPQGEEEEDYSVQEG